MTGGIKTREKQAGRKVQGVQEPQQSLGTGLEQRGATPGVYSDIRGAEALGQKLKFKRRLLREEGGGSSLT